MAVGRDVVWALVGFRASMMALSGEFLFTEPRGEEGGWTSPWLGEAEREGVLKGWKETEVRRPIGGARASPDRKEDREPCEERWSGNGGLAWGESVGDGGNISPAARRAEMGLEPIRDPSL